MTDDRKPIEPTRDQGTNSPEAAGDAGADSLRNAVGAYLLDALPDAERDAFEAFLPSSPETLDELRDLAPVVALLPKLLDLDQTAEPALEPSAELRDRILAVAIAERVPAIRRPKRPSPRIRRSRSRPRSRCELSAPRRSQPRSPGRPVRRAAFGPACRPRRMPAPRRA